MSIDLLGPGNAPNSTTVEPTDSVSFGATDTWFQDCPPGTTSGGTFMSALWFNRMLQQVRNAIRGMNLLGTALSNANPNMLLNAIQLAGKNPPFGVDSSTTPGQIIVALSPAFPSLNDGDNIYVKIAQPCPGGATTIAISGVGTFNVTHNDATILVPNDYVVGQMLDLRFDGTEFQIGRSLQPGAGSITAPMLAAGAAPLGAVGTQPADNLQLSNDATNATRDIDISIGRVRDDSDVTNLQLAGAMAKRLDTAWAPGGGIGGTSQGACDTGTKGNSQTWHAYLIGKLAISVSAFSRSSNVASLTLPTGHNLGVGGTVRVIGVGGGFDGIAVITAVTSTSVSYNNGGANVGTTSCTATADGFDILASQSYPSPAMPSGWTTKQCLGSFLTDASANVIAMKQFGDQFELATGISTGTISATGPVTLSVPNGIAVEAIFGVSVLVPSGGGSIVAGPTGGGPTQTLGFLTVSGAGGNMQSGTVSRIRVNTARSVTVAPQTGCSFNWTTLGWRDPRRRLF